MAQFCDHSVTSADVRLSVGVELSRIAGANRRSEEMRPLPAGSGTIWDASDPRGSAESATGVSHAAEYRQEKFKTAELPLVLACQGYSNWTFAIMPLSS